ncbi:MAG: CinA family nicotinamide mononucleotide deamidase-related protein [Bacteroidia bacterium]|nr:CinA family nicotinamide mononucleotide deamidase-related protein [Bacteroidia bacterium]
MKSLIINIGDELLVGQTINSNAARMGTLMNMAGIPVEKTLVVRDRKEDILSALEEGMRYDVVLITGGLGPTKDDITKKTFADFFGVNLVMNHEVLDDVKRYFARRGRTLTELNRMQAMVPEGCKIIRNPNGTAPGMWMEKNNTIFISMPGVPYEMLYMMDNTVIPELQKIHEIKTLSKILHRTLVTVGIGESLLAEKISGWEESAAKKGFSLAYLPQPGMVRLRLSHYQATECHINEAEQLINELKPLIREWYLGEEMFGNPPLTVQKALFDICKEKNISIGFAESCTGGHMSSLITSIPGSSEIFRGSVVSYSNTSKIRLLGVRPQTLEEHGAVSEACVLEMLHGLLKELGCDYGIAVSGIAGPSGGTPEKPVGTVWLAFGSTSSPQTKLLQLGDNRERNIHLASIYALNELRKLILST